MTETRSRHDHFPRADRARRRRIGAAKAALEARWAAADACPDGLLAAIDALADAPPAVAPAAAPAAVVAALTPWLVDPRWLGRRLSDALALLAVDPFARPPLHPIGGGEGTGGLILAERGAIRLSLQLHPFTCSAVARSALFVPGIAAIRVLANGGAQIQRHHVAVSADERAGRFTAAGAAPCRSDPPRALVTDEILRFDTACESFALGGARGDVLLLELTVQPPSPLPVRTYDIESGRLTVVSAARRDSSFRQMALTLLRSLGRRDAAPLFAAETESEDFAARWAAMRELVALDATAARPHLERMAAADPHPEVRRAAGSALALYAREGTAPCPA